MRKRLCALVVGLLAVHAAPSFAQGEMSAEEKAAMEKWMAYATPGEAHKVLAARTGTWNLKVSQFMKPDEPPMVSEATSTITAVMDGRYFEDVTHGTSMGMPFDGHGFTGYDNLNKKYVSIWMDNMSTSILRMEGSYDAAKKMFTFTGNMPEPTSGKNLPTRSEEKWVSDSEWHVTMYGQEDGKNWTKMMELAYTRAK